jgi:transcriptional regulator with XRE-family HTH domain
LELEAIFANLLKKYRQSHNLTQEDLAFMANVDRTFVSMLEGGKRQPTLTTLFALSKAVNREPSDLIREIEKETNFESMDAESYIDAINPKRTRN